MKNNCFKKGLVIGIIVLFIGVGIQPAFANEVSITKTSEDEEDCNCNPISDIQVVRIERLLDRIESRINFILLRHGHIPEVAEKCRLKTNTKKQNNDTDYQSFLHSFLHSSSVYTSCSN